MSITYNPSNDNIFDITQEKTDHKTDYKTDYDTDPGRVTKRESYRHCWRNYWGNTVCDTRYRTVTDWDKIRRHEEMNEGNDQTNRDNTALNEKNVKRNKAYEDAVTTAKTTQSGQYSVKRNELRASDVDDDAKSILEQQFKAFYRDKKLQEWNSDLGTKPDYGAFDPSYYGATYKDVKDAY